MCFFGGNTASSKRAARESSGGVRGGCVGHADECRLRQAARARACALCTDAAGAPGTRGGRAPHAHARAGSAVTLPSADNATKQLKTTQALACHTSLHTPAVCCLLACAQKHAGRALPASPTTPNAAQRQPPLQQQRQASAQSADNTCSSDNAVCVHNTCIAKPAARASASTRQHAAASAHEANGCVVSECATAAASARRGSDRAAGAAQPPVAAAGAD